MTNSTHRVVRQALGAGRWFPANPAALKKMVEGYIDQATVPPVSGRIIGGIAPHAGFHYSGKVAGYTFRALRDQAQKDGEPDTVIVLGFSHRMAVRGVALMDGDAIATPLGEAALDTDAMALMTNSSPIIRCDYRPHDGEHSAENEIPFVQCALPKARLVVAIIGDHDHRTLSELTTALTAVSKKKKVVVIASSDMLHDASYEIVTQTDKATLKLVGDMRTDEVLAAWNPERQVFCGISAVATVMRYAGEQGCKQAAILHYRNSGDDYPESRGQWVVGYGAVVFAVP